MGGGERREEEIDRNSLEVEGMEREREKNKSRKKSKEEKMGA